MILKYVSGVPNRPASFDGNKSVLSQLRYNMARTNKLLHTTYAIDTRIKFKLLCEMSATKPSDILFVDDNYFRLNRT